MANQNWVALLNGHGSWQAGPGPSVTQQADTEVTPTPTVQLPAGFTEQGDAYRITAHGMTVVGSTATNGTWKLWTGATAPATGDTLLTTGALALLVSQTTPWRLEALMTYRTVGAAATAKVWCQGMFWYGSSATVTTSLLLPLTVPALVGTNLATTAAQGIWMTALMSQSTGAPTCTCQQFIIEQLN